MASPRTRSIVGEMRPTLSAPPTDAMIGQSIHFRLTKLEQCQLVSTPPISSSQDFWGNSNLEGRAYGIRPLDRFIVPTTLRLGAPFGYTYVGEKVKVAATLVNSSTAPVQITQMQVDLAAPSSADPSRVVTESHTQYIQPGKSRDLVLEVSARTSGQHVLTCIAVYTAGGEPKKIKQNFKFIVARPCNISTDVKLLQNVTPAGMASENEGERKERSVPATAIVNIEVKNETFPNLRIKAIDFIPSSPFTVSGIDTPFAGNDMKKDEVVKHYSVVTAEQGVTMRGPPIVVGVLEVEWVASLATRGKMVQNVLYQQEQSSKLVEVYLQDVPRSVDVEEVLSCTAVIKNKTGHRVHGSIAFIQEGQDALCPVGPSGRRLPAAIEPFSVASAPISFLPLVAGTHTLDSVLFVVDGTGEQIGQSAAETVFVRKRVEITGENHEELEEGEDMEVEGARSSLAGKNGKDERKAGEEDSEKVEKKGEDVNVVGVEEEVPTPLVHTLEGGTAEMAEQRTVSEVEKVEESERSVEEEQSIMVEEGDSGKTHESRRLDEEGEGEMEEENLEDEKEDVEKEEEAESVTTAFEQMTMKGADRDEKEEREEKEQTEEKEKGEGEGEGEESDEGQHFNRHDGKDDVARARSSEDGAPIRAEEMEHEEKKAEVDESEEEESKLKVEVGETSEEGEEKRDREKKETESKEEDAKGEKTGKESDCKN